MKINKEEINIRYAVNNDYLWLAENDKHISENNLKNKIETNEVYILEINGKIVGWLRYNLFWDNIPFMNMIYFIDEYRNIGLGKILCNY